MIEMRLMPDGGPSQSGRRLVLMHRGADEQSRKKGENIGLKKRDKKFQEAEQGARDHANTGDSRPHAH